MIKLMIAAASLALRVGLRALLEEADENEIFNVAAEAASLESPLPDVTIILVAGEIKITISPEEADHLPSLLILTRDADSARSVLQHWPGLSWGVLAENSTGADLAIALLALAQGLRVGSPTLLDELSGQKKLFGSETEITDLEVLTAREREVLACLAQGFANKQISVVLGISEHTVKFHVSAIYTKLGVNSRMEAVRIGVKQGLVTL